MEKPNEPSSVQPSPRRKLTPAQRRLLLLGLAFGLGVSCGFVPEEWQVVCRGAVKVLLFFVSPG